jgi:hypothetical protein
MVHYYQFIITIYIFCCSHHDHCHHYHYHNKNPVAKDFNKILQRLKRVQHNVPKQNRTFISQGGFNGPDQITRIGRFNPA